MPMVDNILVPIDFSEGTESVLLHAERIARAFGAKVWLVHVAVVEPAFVGYEVGPSFVRHSVADQLRSEHQQLQNRQKYFQNTGIDATSLLVRGDPGDKILDEIDRLRADMVVMGSHGHGTVHQFLTGSVCSDVLKRCNCPVLVVPRHAFPLDEGQ
jgi:nucleotide-binding universal stress UspA family protein